MENNTPLFKPRQIIKYNGEYYLIIGLEHNAYYVKPLDGGSCLSIAFRAPIQEVDDYNLDCFFNNNWDSIFPISREVIDKMVDDYVESFSNVLHDSPGRSNLIGVMADSYREGIEAACKRIKLSL